MISEPACRRRSASSRLHEAARFQPFRVRSIQSRCGPTRMPCVTPPQLRPLAGDDQLVIAATAAPAGHRPAGIALAGARRAGSFRPEQDRARAVGLDRGQGRACGRCRWSSASPSRRQPVAADDDGRVLGGLRGSQRRPLETGGQGAPGCARARDRWSAAASRWPSRRSPDAPPSRRARSAPARRPRRGNAPGARRRP